MKYYMSLIAAAALALSACGDNKPAEQPAAPPAQGTVASEAAPASDAPASKAASAPASEAAAPAAGECATVVESNDAMQYNVKELNVKASCKEFTVTLKHTGSAKKAAMGHNIVIAKTADVSEILKGANEAGADKDYLQADDPRILAHSGMIGGGEETTLKLDTSKLSKDGDYEFFCSFPGHEGVMKGSVKLVD